MVQTRGYNAFSYADISAEVGIRKASIHYYFPSKTDLGKELVTRYRNAVRLKRAVIDLEPDGADQKLIEYAHIYRQILRDGMADEGGMLCLCGTLASDLMSLPEPLQADVRAFFTENVAWLAGVLDEGRASGVLKFDGLSLVQAQSLLAGLEGAMLVARVYKDVTRYCSIAHQLLGPLGVNVPE
jgi:TetR/AcrR family transcriptional repressor of nem operon